MSYGRQQYQAHRPQFPPAPANQGIGQNGPRQAGNARLPQGGIRRETWRPSVTSPERHQHRSAGGPSGYRDQNPPPAPFYPPPPTGYDAYPAQPFVHPSRQVQPPFPPPNRYPDHPPPNPPAAFHTDRFVPPPLPRPSSPGFRDPPPPRDPSAFIHPSRRAPIPPAFASTSGPSPGRSQVNDQMQFSETSRSSDAVPPSRRAERRSTSPRTAPYSDRHGKGKARDDFSQDSRARDSAFDSRRSRREEPNSRGRSPTRSPLSPSPVRTHARDRRRRSSRSSSYSRSRSPSRYKRRTSSSRSRSRSPKRVRRRSYSRSRSRSRDRSPRAVKKRRGSDRRRRSRSRPSRAARRSPSYESWDNKSPSRDPSRRSSPGSRRRSLSRSLSPPSRKGSRRRSVSQDRSTNGGQSSRFPPRDQVAVTAVPQALEAPSLHAAAPVRISLKPANGHAHLQAARPVSLDPDDAFERLVSRPVKSAPAPPSSPPRLDPRAELARKQHGWDMHLEDVAPYIQSAFFEWERQARPLSELEDFVARFLRRPARKVELQLLVELHQHYVRFTEEKRTLDARIEALASAAAGPVSAPQTQAPTPEAAVPEPVSQPVAVHTPAHIPSIASPRRERKPTPRTTSTADTPSSNANASPRDPPSQAALPPAAPDETYQRLAQVGEGTYGKVYKARHIHTGGFVALKRIRMEGEKDGFPVTAMREIKLLQSLDHPNVIRLHEMMISKGSVYMVMQYMDHDLTGLLAQPNLTFSPANLKSLNHQMLSALGYLHHRGILHRDMKGSNILLNAKGELKLADFGLARLYNRRKKSDYTNRVITLWYRGPELLLGETVYGPEVDMWSAGCIMLELFTTRPIFQGNDEIHQLEVIYNVCGTPSEDAWPRLKELPWYELVKPKATVPCRFRESFSKWLSPAALDLAEGLLTYDPAKRLSAHAALEMPYFTTEAPEMEMPGKLLHGRGEHHELTAKQDRARRRREKEA